MNKVELVKSSLEGHTVMAFEFNGNKYLRFRRRYEKRPVWNVHIEAGLPITHCWVGIDGRKVPRAVREFAKSSAT